VKEKKKSFFSQAQIESSRKSEEEMKKKEEIKAKETKAVKAQKQEIVSEVIYVTDLSNHRIQKFNPEGEFITKWGGEGSGDGEFKKPEGIAISKK